MLLNLPETDSRISPGSLQAFLLIYMMFGARHCSVGLLPLFILFPLNIMHTEFLTEVAFYTLVYDSVQLNVHRTEQVIAFSLVDALTSKLQCIKENA